MALPREFVNCGIIKIMELARSVKELGYELGFDLVSISSAEPLEQERERYQAWREKGYAAELSYMVREYPRRWSPQDLLPEARSVITFAANFFSGSARVEPKRGFGRVARYAWGKDYHIVIRKRLEAWAKLLCELVGRPVKTKILVDSSPLLERAFAHESGSGFVGKNTLLISRKLGSFIFLAEVLTDLELLPDKIKISDARAKDDCGACKECLKKCPTGALVSSRELDVRKCISYWTIENREEIPEALRPQIGDWIFGCDICQEVCPYNGLNRQTKWKEFFPESGRGPYLSILDVLSIKSEDEFRQKFAGTPIMRAKRFGLVRNACVVAANQKFVEAAPQLQEMSARDSDPVVRAHALWAFNQLRNFKTTAKTPEKRMALTIPNIFNT